MHVLIVDDHPLFIKGVQALLAELEPGIETSGARSLDEAMAAICSVTPDLVLLDLKLPGTHDLDALVQMRALLDSTPIIVISGNDSYEYIWKAIDLGASGYIPKDTDQSLMIQALRFVLARGVYIPPQALRGELMPSPQSRGVPAPALPSLTKAQMAVLQVFLQGGGKSNKVIARDLGIAETTVKSHMGKIISELGVSSRTQVMAKVHELRLVEKFGRME